MSKNINIPKLRFKEFSSEWKIKSLSQVSTMKAGKFVKASNILYVQENDTFPCYGGNGLRGYTKTQTHDGIYPLIGRQGAHCGNVQLAKDKFHATEHAVVVTPTNENDTLWLYYELNRLNLNRFATGQAQPGLSVDVIQQIKTYFPSKQEQEKIASFLTSVDTKIEQLTKKKSLLKEYKKGVMQKIFNQEIRFKEDDGSEFCDWEEKNLGKISDVRDGTHDSPKYYDEGYPLITSKNLLSNGDIDFKNINLIMEEDYININKRSNVNIGDILFGMIGTIGNPVIVKSENFAIKNVALIKEQKKLLNKFLIHYLKSLLIEKQFYEQNTGGTQKFIALGVIRNLIVKLPTLEEQIKIANFLSEIDTKLEQTQKQLEQTKEFKKALLQTMFV